MRWAGLSPVRRCAWDPRHHHVIADDGADAEATITPGGLVMNKKKTTVTVPTIKVDIPQENEKTIDASTDADDK